MIALLSLPRTASPCDTKFWQVSPYVPKVKRTSNPKAHLPLASFPSESMCTVSLTPDQHLKLIFPNTLTFESPGSPAKTHMASPHAYTAGFNYCRWGLRNGISDKFPVDADAIDLNAMFGNSMVYLYTSYQPTLTHQLVMISSN